MPQEEISVTSPNLVADWRAILPRAQIPASGFWIDYRPSASAAKREGMPEPNGVSSKLRRKGAGTAYEGRLPCPQVLGIFDGLRGHKSDAKNFTAPILSSHPYARFELY